MANGIVKTVDIKQPLAYHSGKSLVSNVPASANHTKGAPNKVDVVDLHRRLQGHDGAKRVSDYVNITPLKGGGTDSLEDCITTLLLNLTLKKILEIAESVEVRNPVSKLIDMLI